MLKPADHQRIAAAIEAAEARTSGEIFCIVTEEVSHYREVPLAWAAGAALILPPIALLAGLHPLTLAAFGDGGWSQASGFGQGAGFGQAVSAALGAYALVQAALFAAVAGLVSIPVLRRGLTPRFLVRHRVKRTAYAHFASTGLSHVETRTGVLIFASLADRQVELVADAAIHRAVGDAAWDAAVAALVAGVKSADPASGFVRAVELCGAALAEHFPASGAHAPHGDGVVEL